MARHGSIEYFREKDIREIIRKHVEDGQSEVGSLEEIGAMKLR